MGSESKIPLSGHYKGSIVRAIFEAHKKDLPDFYGEYDLETFNCRHFLKWDFTNTNIIRSFLGKRFHCIKVKRGSWRFVLIYDKETKFLYSLMKEKRFIELQDKTKLGKIHYLYALASINKELKRKIEQLSLFTIDNNQLQNDLKNVLHEMIQNIDGEINNYVLISFSTEKHELVSVSAYIPTAGLDIAYKESWNEFIPADFDTLSDYTDNINQSDEDEINIALREEILPNNNDDMVQLKSNEKEENEDK